MSALPKAVRAQVEKADQIAAEYYKALAQPPAPGSAPPSSETPPAPPSGETPPAPPVQGAPVATPPEPPKEGWEQKYKVLQGKYNAEVPRLQAQTREQGEAVRQLREQLTATQNLLASLSAQRAADPAQSPTGTPPVPARLVKDEEIREFGPDLIDVMRRVVREEASQLVPAEIDRHVKPVAQRVDQVAQATQQVGSRVAQNDQQAVLSMLASAVPNWREVNADQGFLDWLDQVDPYVGVRRGELLTQAYKAHDGPRVVAFFTGYQKEHAAVNPPAVQPTPAAAPSAAPQKSLEQFVAPGTPKTGAASTPNGSGGRVWSRAEISQFYVDVQQGKYRTRPDEQKKLEADIFAAQREGRIR